MQRKKRKRHNIFIALGSNLGDSIANIVSALDKIENDIGPIKLCSSMYETEPWGEPDQNNFVNAVCMTNTLYSPYKVMALLQTIESDLFRKKIIKWGPRTIDLDIIYYNEKIIIEKDLIIPHPNMYLRNFVLAPLSEIAPDYIHPVLKKSTKSMLQECPDNGRVKKIIRDTD